MSPRLRTLSMLLTLLFLALLSRGPAVFNDYVGYDDGLLLTNNPILRRGLTPEGFKFAFTDAHTAFNWVPLTYVSYMIDMQVFGPGPLGPHLTNVLLHAGSVLILFLALRALTGTFWRSAAVAAVLAVHPIHTESIAWVAERRDVLSLFFGALCLWAYACYARSSSKFKVQSSKLSQTPSPTLNFELGTLNYFLALLAFAASLMAKPMLVTLPFVLLLLDYWPLKRSGVWKLLAEKLPFFAGVVAVSAVTMAAQRQAMTSAADIPWLIRLVNIPVAYGWYLYRMAWPVRLPPYYAYQLLWPAWVVIGAPVLLAAISITLFLQCGRRPWLLVGWLWFLGAMVPVIGLVQVGGVAFACRYAYFPFIGLYIAIVWTLGEWARSSSRRMALGVLSAAVLAFFVVASMLDTQVWKDSMSLYSYAVDVGPDAALPEAGLGAILQLNRRFDEAIKHWRRSVCIDMINNSNADTLAKIHAVSGTLSLGRGDVASAVTALGRAVEVSPYNGQYRYHLARALEAAGRYEDAAASDAEAVRLSPGAGPYWHHWGQTLLEAGKPVEAVVKLTEAAATLAPGDANVWFNLGQAYLSLNQPTDAEAAIRRAVSLAPDSSAAHNELGMVLGRSGRTAEAAAEFALAVKLDPKFGAAADNLRKARAALAQERRTP